MARALVWHRYYAAHKSVVGVFMHCGGKVRLEVTDQKGLHGFVKKPTSPETEMIMTGPITRPLLNG